MTKSRLQLTKLTGGARGLSDQTVENDGDTCRDRGGGIVDMPLHKDLWFVSKSRDGRFSGLGLKI
jgi:hypothetical protein